MTFYKTHNSSGENFQIYKISSFSPHCNIPIRPCKLKIKKNYTLRYNCINRKKKSTFHYFIFIPVYNNTKNCNYNTFYLKAELQLKIREKISWPWIMHCNDQLTCFFKEASWWSTNLKQHEICLKLWHMIMLDIYVN